MIDEALGDFFKSKEEKFRHQLDRNKITIIRLDGMRFHTFTRPFIYPFDPFLRFSLDQSLLEVITKELKSYVALVYFQSDEASIILPPLVREEDHFPFRGRIEKLTAVLLQWNVYFYTKLQNLIHFFEIPSYDYKLISLLDYVNQIPLALGQHPLDLVKYTAKMALFLPKCRPCFDCRFLQVDTIQETQDYLTWRRKDAIRNYRSMMGYSLFSPKELQDISAFDITQLVKQRFNIDYDSFPTLMKRGTLYRTIKFKDWIDDRFRDADELTIDFQRRILNEIDYTHKIWM